MREGLTLESLIKELEEENQQTVGLVRDQRLDLLIERRKDNFTRWKEEIEKEKWLLEEGAMPKIANQMIDRTDLKTMEAKILKKHDNKECLLYLNEKINASRHPAAAQAEMCLNMEP